MIIDEAPNPPAPTPAQKRALSRFIAKARKDGKLIEFSISQPLSKSDAARNLAVFAFG